MSHIELGLAATPEVPAIVTFQDVDAEMIAHQEAVQRQSRAALGSGSAWGEYMRKVLSPAIPQPTMRLLRSAQA